MIDLKRQEIDDSRTDEQKAIDDLVHMEFDKSWFLHCSDIVEAIKADKIHGVKWVGK